MFVERLAMRLLQPVRAWHSNEELGRERATRSAAGANSGAAHRSLRGNPYYFLNRRPYKAANLRSYIVREHRRGRPLAEILSDPSIRRYGGESLLGVVLEDPRTIEALEQDVLEAIKACKPGPSTGGIR
jgi:hypothetical protein